MLKDEFSIDFIDVGIMIRDNDEHPLNIDFPIDVTDDGIDIFVRNMHNSNAPFEII